MQHPRTSRAARRSQKRQPPLPAVDVLEQSSLPTCRPQIERVARQPMTAPGVLDLVGPSRPVQRRHQLERVARTGFRRRWPASEPGERIRDSGHQSCPRILVRPQPTGHPAAASPRVWASTHMIAGVHTCLTFTPDRPHLSIQTTPHYDEALGSWADHRRGDDHYPRAYSCWTAGESIHRASILFGSKAGPD
jgi:hypothetical protein